MGRGDDGHVSLTEVTSMTEGDARNCLFFHAFRHKAPDGRLDESGFLGMLRPYRGLREENFHEVMAALAVLGPKWSTETTVDRELIASLWAMCLLARTWGVEPCGMLRRNHLISDADVQRLEEWINIISWAVFFLIDG